MSDSTLLIRELQRGEIEEAARVVARGMCDNPVNVSAFATVDRERRLQAHNRFFRPVLRGIERRGLIYGAFRDGALMGVCAIARPGACRPSSSGWKT